MVRRSCIEHCVGLVIIKKGRKKVDAEYNKLKGDQMSKKIILLIIGILVILFVLAKLSGVKMCLYNGLHCI